MKKYICIKTIGFIKFGLECDVQYSGEDFIVSLDAADLAGCIFTHDQLNKHFIAKGKTKAMKVECARHSTVGFLKGTNYKARKLTDDIYIVDGRRFDLAHFVSAFKVLRQEPTNGKPAPKSSFLEMGEEYTIKDKDNLSHRAIYQKDNDHCYFDFYYTPGRVDLCDVEVMGKYEEKAKPKKIDAFDAIQAYQGELINHDSEKLKHVPLSWSLLDGVVMSHGLKVCTKKEFELEMEDLSMWANELPSVGPKAAHQWKSHKEDYGNNNHTITQEESDFVQQEIFKFLDACDLKEIETMKDDHMLDLSEIRTFAYGYIHNLTNEPVNQETAPSSNGKHKHHVEIKAWADGAVIETSNFGGLWEECGHNIPRWLDNMKYRVKPSPQVVRLNDVADSLRGSVELTSEVIEAIKLIQQAGYMVPAEVK